MKNIFIKYKKILFLFLGIITGCIIGIIFKEKATFLKPFGDIFLNLMLVSIIPLIFFNISVSIGKMKDKKRFNKIILVTFLVFAITSIVSLILSFIVTLNIELINKKDLKEINKIFSDEEINENKNEISVLERTKDVLTVDDFYKLLSKENIIALILFSILIGLSINKLGDRGKKCLEILESFNEVICKFIDIIMLYAPIGLGAYFAYLVATLGDVIVFGFLKTFIVYLIISIFYFFIVYTVYAYFSYGKEGIKNFYKNVFPIVAISIATCSSAASIPINIKQTKKIGVANDIAETVIPLGTSFHKDGSIIGAIIKIMFLVTLFGIKIVNFENVFFLLIIALVANLFVAAVPIGGGTISEMFIITMLGVPIYALPILTIIATIIDAPATMLNVTGDTVSSMIVSKIIDKKNVVKSV